MPYPDRGLALHKMLDLADDQPAHLDLQVKRRSKGAARHQKAKRRRHCSIFKSGFDDRSIGARQPALQAHISLWDHKRELVGHTIGIVHTMVAPATDMLRTRHGTDPARVGASIWPAIVLFNGRCSSAALAEAGRGWAIGLAPYRLRPGAFAWLAKVPKRRPSNQ